jgi:hypothetical protein
MTLMALLFFIVSSAFSKPKPRVLVFCKTAGYHHESIANGIVAIQKLGMENNFVVDATVGGLLMKKAMISARLSQWAIIQWPGIMNMMEAGRFMLN